ncbi:MAG: DUF4185 domain-containing protein [Bacteroidales bacterium]|nr:DUF4185 domain-containing protein [Bacteroidales bacterium]
MKRFFVALAATFVAVVACQKKDEPISVAPVDTHANTEASFELAPGGPTFTWKSGEAVSVFDGKANNKFTYVDGFEGVACENTDLQILYPYNASSARFDGKVKMAVAASQTVVAGGIDKSNVILVANSTKGKEDWVFKSALAFGKLTVSLSAAPAAIEISATGALAGEVNVPLTSPFVAEAGANTVSTISLGGNLKGVLYFSAIPGQISNITVTVITTDQKRAVVKIDGDKTLSAAKVTDFGSLGDADVIFPSTIEKTGVFKVSFAEDEFNLVSEPGFEEYPDRPINFATRWVTSVDWNRANPVDLVYAENEGDIYKSHSGERAAALRTVDSNKRFWNLMEQTVPMTVNTDYVFTVWADANNVDCFMGVNCKGEANTGHEIPGEDWTQNGGFGGAWEQLSMEFNTGADWWGYLFFGDWGEGLNGWSAGAWWNRLYLDDIRLIPKGYDKKSTKPTTVEFKGMIANNAASVSGNGKVVAWPDGAGNVAVALSNPSIQESSFENTLAIASDVDFSAGLALSKYAAGAAPTPILNKSGNAIEIIINGGFYVGDKIYVHYAAKQSDDYVDNPKLARWTNAYNGFLVSSDNGATWTAGPQSTDPYYSQASFCVKDDYICMVHCWAGRTDVDTDAFFVSRIAKTSSDIDDIAKWERWDGITWNTDPLVGDRGQVTKGAMSEPAIIWNPKYQRFMMFYRSFWQHGIIYRDADKLEGPWSGEKVITCDEINGSWYAPSALAVDADGSVWLTASEFSD